MSEFKQSTATDVDLYACADKKCRETRLQPQFENTPEGAVLKNWEIRLRSTADSSDVIVKGKSLFYQPSNEVDWWLASQKTEHKITNIVTFAILGIFALCILVNVLYMFNLFRKKTEGEQKLKQYLVFIGHYFTRAYLKDNFLLQLSLFWLQITHQSSK